MDDYPIPRSRGKGRKTVLPIIRLIPSRIHLRLQLGAGFPSLWSAILLSNTRMNVINKVGLSRGQLSVFSQKHDPRHRRIIFR